MNGTVVGVYWDQESGGFRCNLFSPKRPDGTRLQVLDLTPLQPFLAPLSQGAISDGLVEKLGMTLAQQLCAHNGIRAALESAQGVPDNESAPIYVRLDAMADAVPWETLNVNGKFLALDRRWPIGRIADTTDGISANLLHSDFTPPLRVLAVLGAAGISAAAQWDVLYAPFKNSKLQTEFTVYVCESDLHERLKKLPNVTAEYITDDFRLSAIVNQMTQQSRAPHVLHFFCHGSSGRAPYLQLATRTDFVSVPPVGHVRVEPAGVIDANQLGSIWLVTFNCCEAAAASSDVVSFARTIIDSGLFPAVIGMRETVVAHHADLFCKWLYAATEQFLASRLLGDETIQFDWAAALYDARQQLLPSSGQDGQNAREIAGGSKEWTLPVLYVRAQPMSIRPRKSDGFQLPFTARQSAGDLRNARDEWTALTDFRANAAADVPRPILDFVDSRIEVLEKQLYPPDVAALLAQLRRAGVQQLSKLAPAFGNLKRSSPRK